MRTIHFIGSMVSGNFSAVANGKSYSIRKDHPAYDKLMEAIRTDDVASLEQNYNVSKAIMSYTQGKIEVRDDLVYYNGEPCLHQVADEIIRFMNAGLPHEPLVNFLEKLLQNSSKRAVTELWNWLNLEGLVITEDGDFLGYKRITQDWLDCYSKKISNRIGESPEMIRNTVDDDWGVVCSQGFHVGSLHYVQDFNTDGRIVIVKVNPKDVVTVPSGECHKLRTCKYLVLKEFEGKLTEPLYRDDGSRISSAVEEDVEEDDAACDNLDDLVCVDCENALDECTCDDELDDDVDDTY